MRSRMACWMARSVLVSTFEVASSRISMCARFLPEAVLEESMALAMVRSCF